jgi:hypothetical protein
LSELTDSIGEIISKIYGYVCVLASSFLESSRKTKIISICAAVVVIFLLMQLFSGPPPRPTRKSLGLRSLNKKDANDDEWVLALVRGQTISKLGEIEAKPGEPLSVRPDVQAEGRGLSIGLIVEGKAGEKYVGGAIKNGEWMPAPTFTVVSQAGKIIYNGQFEYG